MNFPTPCPTEDTVATMTSATLSDLQIQTKKNASFSGTFRSYILIPLAYVLINRNANAAKKTQYSVLRLYANLLLTCIQQGQSRWNTKEKETEDVIL